MIKTLWAIGIDLGATKAAIAQVDCLGIIHEKMVVPTGNSKSAEEVIDSLIATIKKLIGKSSVLPQGIGIGIAGQIDSKHITVLHAPNLNWHDVHIGWRLQHEFDIPVAILNDVRAIARGEWKYGVGQGSQNLVCMFIGTGIGGGIVSNGKMLTGDQNSAGEIGHITVNFNGPKCACGNIGCMEAYAGGAAIGKRLQEEVEKHPFEGELLVSLAGGNRHAITGKILPLALDAGCPLAKKVFDNASSALIAGAVSIVNTLNPEILILGGGVIDGQPELVDIIAQGIRQYALKTAAKSLKVVRSTLGSDAGILGAASIILEK